MRCSAVSVHEASFDSRSHKSAQRHSGMSFGEIPSRAGVSKSKRRSQSVMRVSLVLLLAFALVVPTEAFLEILSDLFVKPLVRMGQAIGIVKTPPPPEPEPEPALPPQMAPGQGPYMGPPQGANTPAPRSKGSFHSKLQTAFVLASANFIRVALF
ncbi:unnamed protein product [Caenorhabditis auriculariae]|uniref:Transmembrane protein n=1 Tax=Caenorhabditis auriculariae TaxID=2777116 RepID=A0A8S1HR94_9PELO|nr:unnamed protein product [Caenorhabditis auriculariae]